MTDEILRTFIAIELDASVRQALQVLQNRYRKQVPPGSVKWVAPEGIHLTLKFLGDTRGERIPEIAAGCRAACSEFAPFEMSVEGRGCFPNFHRPRVIWVAVRDPGQTIARLQRAVEFHIAPLGWPAETRGFTPHLTLGRLSNSADPRATATVGQIIENSVVEQIGTQRVSGASLIKSELLPTGALYTHLFEAPFSNSLAGR